MVAPCVPENLAAWGTRGGLFRWWTYAFALSYRSTNLHRHSGISRFSSAQSRVSSRAISSDTSRDQPSDVLKAMARTGLEYCPSSKSRMIVPRSVSSIPVSRQAKPRLPQAQDRCPDLCRGRWMVMDALLDLRAGALPSRKRDPQAP